MNLNWVNWWLIGLVLREDRILKISLIELFFAFPWLRIIALEASRQIVFQKLRKYRKLLY